MAVNFAARRVVAVEAGEEDLLFKLASTGCAVSFEDARVPGAVFGAAVDETVFYALQAPGFAALLASPLLKLHSRPRPALEALARELGVECRNCVHVTEYLVTVGAGRLVPRLKRDLLALPGGQAGLQSLPLLLMHYKELAARPSRLEDAGQRHACYLRYLSAFNAVLLDRGPLPFLELAGAVRRAPLCDEARLAPAMALEGLVAVGALRADAATTVVSLPEQAPVTP